MTDQNDKLLPALERIADALERLSPADKSLPDLSTDDAFVWHAEDNMLEPVLSVSHVSLGLLKGIDHVRDILQNNTQQFADGFPANNALLWGARGMGKSSLVKALHAHVKTPEGDQLVLIEIHREDIHSLPHLMNVIRRSNRRVILFCDDLSFDDEDSSYKSLKAVLEGGLQGRPDNVIFYATSNRRHLMPRDMMENERSSAITPSEAVEEKVSLSDRFGLWLGYHACSQDNYLSIIDTYLDHFDIPGDRADIHHQALAWSTTRGARSGRVAWQFIQDLAGKNKIKITP